MTLNEEIEGESYDSVQHGVETANRKAIQPLGTTMTGSMASPATDVSPQFVATISVGSRK